MFTHYFYPLYPQYSRYCYKCGGVLYDSFLWHNEHKCNCHLSQTYYNNVSIGWQCPLCKKIHSPSVTSCDCNIKKDENTNQDNRD